MTPEETPQNLGRTGKPEGLAAFPTQQSAPQGMSTLFLMSLGLGVVILGVLGYFLGNAITAAARPDPHDPQGIVRRYQDLASQGEYVQANAELERAIKLDPKNDWYHNELAWNLATCPKAYVRDGARAVGEATRACELSKWSNGGWVDTLASAYAETGDFKSAVNWEQYALSIPDVPPDLRNELKARLELFQSGKAYHEDAAP